MKDKEMQFKERIDCGIAYCEDIPNNQIEEMAKELKELAKTIRTVLEDRTDIKYIPDLAFPIAKELLKHYQPKLPEDSVVLTREDLKHYAKDCIIGELAGLDILNGLIERAKRKEKEARKETAEKILKLVKEKSWCYQEDENGRAWTYSITVTQLKELAKQFGVEIKE